LDYTFTWFFTAGRHNSASTYTFMHNTSPTSNAGQLKGCTRVGASKSMAIDTPIFTNCHTRKLTALAPGDVLLSLLVMPRAIKAPGNTTVAAPYNTDHAQTCLPVINTASSANTPPNAA